MHPIVDVRPRTPKGSATFGALSPPLSGFPALVGVVVLVVTLVLTLPALARDLLGAPCDHVGVLDVEQLLDGPLQSPCWVDAVDEPSSRCVMSSSAALSAGGFDTMAPPVRHARFVRGQAALGGLPFEHGNYRAACSAFRWRAHGPDV